MKNANGTGRDARRARPPELGDFPIAWTPDLRARYDALRPAYPWLAEVNEAYQFYMASTSLYRPAWVFPGIPRSEYKGTEPWKELPKEDVDKWRMANLSERWATSDKTAQALCWLFLEFGGYDDPEGR